MHSARGHCKSQVILDRMDRLTYKAAMTKRQLRRHYKTDAAIARLFRIRKQAVDQWELDEPIPARRELQLRDKLRPDLFVAGKRKRA